MIIVATGVNKVSFPNELTKLATIGYGLYGRTRQSL